ncbi:hypothetical protein GDO78_013519 [Eleutherodactylus coqui]|uniref:Uncharacterized protein n=1 Tax=Eleutherodactylus coqui TaxID=57060 RepID=A0A8J6F170_ELECQ|nr:hypothetical protein GDO78_013519 [Eleutherodactylus coqui]
MPVLSKKVRTPTAQVLNSRLLLDPTPLLPLVTADRSLITKKNGNRHSPPTPQPSRLKSFSRARDVQSQEYVIALLKNKN